MSDLVKPKVGDPASDFKMPSIDREEFHLYGELKKGPILLNFYIGDFGINCTTYMTRMIELAKDFNDLGVRIFTINPDGLDSHRSFRDRLGSPYDHIHDIKQEVSKTYGAIVEDSPMIKGFTNREFFLIDTEGKIRYIWRSPVPRVLPNMDELLAEVKKVI
ncbi:MAG: redoxin domain-containing protein [Methanomassiliicoccaceae archaeon]|jgi:peroxiredoxin Q/BCP|nr:redoxin domain-containing protein [Methanomassiliicoccaceae archaeon]